jgi:hypothetical protein
MAAVMRGATRDAMRGAVEAAAPLEQVEPGAAAPLGGVAQVVAAVAAVAAV